MAKIKINRGPSSITVNQPGQPSTIIINNPQDEDVNFIVDSEGNIISDNENNNLIDGE